MVNGLKSNFGSGASAGASAASGAGSAGGASGSNAAPGAGSAGAASGTNAASGAGSAGAASGSNAASGAASAGAANGSNASSGAASAGAASGSNAASGAGSAGAASGSNAASAGAASGSNTTSGAAGEGAANGSNASSGAASAGAANGSNASSAGAANGSNAASGGASAGAANGSNAASGAAGEGAVSGSASGAASAGAAGGTQAAQGAAQGASEAGQGATDAAQGAQGAAAGAANAAPGATNTAQGADKVAPKPLVPSTDPVLGPQGFMQTSNGLNVQVPKNFDPKKDTVFVFDDFRNKSEHLDRDRIPDTSHGEFIARGLQRDDRNIVRVDSGKGQISEGLGQLSESLRNGELPQGARNVVNASLGGFGDAPDPTFKELSSGLGINGLNSSNVAEHKSAIREGIADVATGKRAPFDGLSQPHAAEFAAQDGAIRDLQSQGLKVLHAAGNDGPDRLSAGFLSADRMFSMQDSSGATHPLSASNGLTTPGEGVRPLRRTADGGVDINGDGKTDFAKNELSENGKTNPMEGLPATATNRKLFTPAAEFFEKNFTSAADPEAMKKHLEGAFILNKDEKDFTGKVGQGEMNRNPLMNLYRIHDNKFYMDPSNSRGERQVVTGNIGTSFSVMGPGVLDNAFNSLFATR